MSISTQSLDHEFVRSRFPARETSWTLCDNAGGSFPLRAVADRVADYMRSCAVQLGGGYQLSKQAEARLGAGREAAALLLGAHPEELAFGASATQLAHFLARALAPGLKPGDEVVVTNLDHEANIAPWRLLEREGIRLREWRFDAGSLQLSLEGLEQVLSERTRVVCFTQCPNITGAIQDVAPLCARVRAAGALSVVDGVAFAPHRRVDVGAVGADYYLVSAYKVYGPHVGVLYGRREAWSALTSLNHGFIEPISMKAMLELGSTSYELIASLSEVAAYLQALALQHGAPPGGDARSLVDAAFEGIAAHEELLARRLLAFLGEHPRTRVIGPSEPTRSRRVPTISFVVDGLKSSEVARRLEQHQVAVRWGHFYAERLINALGLAESDGVVRASFVHYDAADDVERLIEALQQSM